MDPTVAAKNLQSIQRIDPFADFILDKATHTALYRFNNDARKWEKTDVDGAMFIYQRVDTPFYSLIIANRQSPNDMIEPITPQTRVKIDAPYIFFCKPDGEIRGLWFYRDEDCTRVFRLIENILCELREGKEKCTNLPRSVVTPVSASPAQLQSGPGPVISKTESETVAERNTNILDMLKAAQTKQQASSRTPPMSVREEHHSQSPCVTDGRPASRRTPQTDVVDVLQKLLDPVQVSSAASALTAQKPMQSVAAASSSASGFPHEKLSQVQFDQSPSVASLQAFSTLSVHGSEDHDPHEIESVQSKMADVDDSEIRAGESAVDVPLLDKAQFVNALTHMLLNNDSFVTELHQAYIDALNRRLGLE